MASLATNIIIHVIGLAVFSRQFGPQRGPLQALLPIVDHAEHKMAAPAAGRARLPAGTGPTAGAGTAEIEPHTAIILFPAGSYVGGHGWTRAPFPSPSSSDTQWEYVVLNGEQLTFGDSAAATKDTSGANTTRARAALGKVRQPVDAEPVDTPLVIDNLGLPSLSGCFKTKKLKAAYGPPNYTGAAAVFTFPTGVATASACSQDPKDENSRTDTQVKFPLYGDLVISTTNRNPQKELVLRNAGKVIIGNIPAHILTGADSSSYTGVHYEIYAEMGEGASTGNFSCARILGLSQCEGTPSPVIVPPRGGDSSGPKQNSQFVVAKPKPPQDPHFPMTDFRCSNTQWP